MTCCSILAAILYLSAYVKGDNYSLPTWYYWLLFIANNGRNVSHSRSISSFRFEYYRVILRRDISPSKPYLDTDAHDDDMHTGFLLASKRSSIRRHLPNVVVDDDRDR